ncbi:MAG: ABC1 kinase family protein [Iamia sp.]
MDREDEPRGASERSRSRRSRGLRLASLPVAHAGRAAVGLGRRIGGRPAEMVSREVQERTADQLFRVLGELKGGAMKVGQAMSAMEAALPAELAEPYREALVRLQEAAPPMSATTMRRVLADGLGPDWAGRLTEVNDRPAAAASIGQVHRGTWHDGRAVAVKVQYPGAAKALAADLRQLDRLAPLVRVGAPGLDPRALFAELHDRLLDEVDYGRESETQEAFAEAFRDDPDIFVPDVVEAADGVLVSEWVGGTPLAKVIAEGSTAQRDRAGLLLVRLLASSPARVGRLHGDPHPGNFRLLDDGRLVVLDFGSWEPMPDGWPSALGTLLVAGRDREARALGAEARRVGLIPDQGVAPAALLDLVDPVLEPLRHEDFTFERSWLQELTRRSSDPRTPQAKVQRQLRVPARHLLVQRVAAGLVGVLCSLGATVPVRAEAERWVPGLH